MLISANYAQDEHMTEIEALHNREKRETRQRVVFKSKSLCLELSATVDCGDEPEKDCPLLLFQKMMRKHHLGDGVTASFRLEKDRRCLLFFAITTITTPSIYQLRRSMRCNVVLENTGRGGSRRAAIVVDGRTAIVAAPTLSLPEDFGGARNWDYRFPEAYTSFIFEQMKEAKATKGALPIMFTIAGQTDIPEIELTHLDGYRSSRPVRTGNGAAFHVQLDIYGELMDGIYLANKYGKPASYDQWLLVHDLTDYVCGIRREKDMSIREVRGGSGLCLVDCSAGLLHPPHRPAILEHVHRILKPPEKGGLASTGLVYRYNSAKSDDGVGGREGAFSMCTFWLVEALTRTGAYDPKYLNQAVSIFENILSFGNHLHMFSGETARPGEQLGDTTQAFSHLSLISAAFNLDRTLGGKEQARLRA
ncbi:glycoside hydrolase family 15 protein [Lentithecium fluviatile CBS 122367]|uniref:Glycoside hydrolase family 15 protein n=1 Tax=Lentithecium fluviatile CBS 122367 TaxID=1168545 RepID=A0A6G1JAY1_9PLEO|nr:glycoside hydrolase family 15 protein [Lentithecium fluviatile CBS 122367]